MELEEHIKDSIDDSMKNYIESDTYKDQCKHIHNQILELRSELNEKQQQQLNSLIDAIGNCNSSFASEAYLRGVISGIALREKLPHIS